MKLKTTIFMIAGALAVLPAFGQEDGGEDGNAPPTANVQTASPQPGSQAQTGVVLRFAVQSQTVEGTSVLSTQACPQTDAADASLTTATPSKNLTVDPNILDAISAEMQTKLSKKMSVMIDPDPANIPVGALTISGCITKANSGNAAARLIGMNVGASHLAVHVVVVSKTKDGWTPVDAFDMQVKGGDLLPPLGPMGLAVHLVRDTHQSLSSDSKKLADHIVKKVSHDMKVREQAA